MESWVWVLIGFVGGIVVYAILNLIFAKDPSDEFEKLADERAAELAKADMKTAVLQDKLVEAETARDEQREKSETECQQKLREAEAECQQKLAAVEADYSEKLTAAEANYRNQLAMVEQQFANLETAFAQQAAEMGATLVAAGLITGAATGVEDADAEQADEVLESDLEALAALDDPDLFDTAWPTSAVAAAFADYGGEEEVLEPTAKVDDEPTELYEAPEEESEESEDGVGEAAIEPETVEDIEAETAAAEVEEDGVGTAAKVVLAAGGAAVAVAELNDDEDEEGDLDAEAASIDEEIAAAGYEEADFAAEIDETEQEPVVPAEEPGEPEDEEEPLDEAEEDAHVGLAAVAVAGTAAGTAAAVLAAAGDDEETGEEPGDETAELEVDEEVEEEVELIGEEGDEQPDEQPETAGYEAETAEAIPDEPDNNELAAASAAAGLAAAMDEEEPHAVDDEPATAVEEEVAAEEEELDESVWPEDASVWSGEYFNNMKLEGEPVLVREDPEVDFDWDMGSPAPEINNDGFSVRWTRTADLPPGLYRFTVTSDDGARLWVNERLVISAWYDHTEMTFRREIELPGGPVELKLEYYENEMAALVRVSWERIG